MLKTYFFVKSSRSPTLSAFNVISFLFRYSSLLSCFLHFIHLQKLYFLMKTMVTIIQSQQSKLFSLSLLRLQVTPTISTQIQKVAMMGYLSILLLLLSAFLLSHLILISFRFTSLQNSLLNLSSLLFKTSNSTVLHFFMNTYR